MRSKSYLHARCGRDGAELLEEATDIVFTLDRRGQVLDVHIGEVLFPISTILLADELGDCDDLVRITKLRTIDILDGLLCGIRISEVHKSVTLRVPVFVGSNFA
jgi:hypothetical protein